MLKEEQVIRLILGFKTRYLRMQKGLSYQQLSKQTGLSTSYLNDIEKGKRYPKPDKISILANALEVDYNYMVSTNASKKLQPIVDLLYSKFFKLFPLREFGINLERLVELFTQTPDKVNAFISTIFRIARNYQIGESEFYLEALRSYQDMHSNYFPSIENASKTFKKEFSIKGTLPYTTAFLEDQLQELYGITIDREQITSNPILSNIRSYFSRKNKILYLKEGLSTAQENFLLAKELGFQYLEFQERPYSTTLFEVDSFEKILNNFKASYFAASLLMDEKNLVKDLKKIMRENTWHPQLLLNLFDKYDVTPETLLQRLTNLLAQHFGIEDLFFIRLTADQDPTVFTMTKNLHLSQLQSPYNNQLEEHYCHRWVSVTAIHDLKKAHRKKPQKAVVADAQISKYWQSDKEYLCISLAKYSRSNKKRGVSVTLGILINPHVKSLFNFLSDPKLKSREVHITCERCGVADCAERVASPIVIQAETDKKVLREVLATL
ncbi:MAG: helix-turn-helix domain-containing protein [Bacteroidota bacterium]